MPFSMKRKKKAPLPPPLCKVYKHPIRWTLQKIEAVIDAGIGAHIGTLIIVALYYLLFEIYAPFTNAWHNAVSDPDLRHMIRGVGEGLLGGSLGQLLVFNSYKHRNLKKPNLLDRFEIKLRIPNLKDPRRLRGWQFALAPVYVLIYAIPGFLIAYFALKGLHAHINNPHTIAHNYADKLKAIWTSEKDQKLVGLFASLVLGRRPLKKIANDTQLWFVERRCAKGTKPRWYHSPTYEARYNEVSAGGVVPSAVGQSGVAATIMGFSVFIGLALAGFGYYVLTEIAQ